MKIRDMAALVVLATLLCVGSGVARAQEGLPEGLRQEVRAPERLPKGRYIPVKTWSAIGPEGKHEIGQEVADPEASTGHAWEGRVGRDKVNAGALLYGPYLDFPAGDYIAFFRMKLMEDPEGEEIAVADTATNGGGNTLSFRRLSGAELPLNRYVEVPVPMRFPGGQLECRIQWLGGSTLRIDRVSLFRLEGGSIDSGVDRAPQPTPTGKPNNLTPVVEPRPYPEVFPRSAPPASHLAVLDLRNLRPDWQLAMLSLEGLVNRSKPRIYCLNVSTDPDWLANMKQRGWVKETEIVPTPEALLKRYRGEVKGMIVTDPTLPASKNVATMLAGVKDGIVVSPRLAQQLDLPILEDLRGRWKTNVQAYRWAFDNLWPQLNHHLLACAFPDHLNLRDYLVENRAFIFWLSGPIDGARPYADPQAEVALMEELLAKMPVNIPIMSYPWAGKEVGIGEGPGVTLFAEFGKYLVGSIDASNLSIHSGIRVPALRQKPAPPAPKLDRSKTYVTWLLSDGDNLPVLSLSNFPALWRDPLHGKLPMAWTATPSAEMLLPDVMDYYYRTSTPNDAWVGAVSGIGYTYPDSYGLRYRASDRRQIFDGFLDQTAGAMRRMDENILWPMNATKPERIARYAQKIPQLQALFPDYGKQVSGYEEATYPTARNVPVFRALTTWQDGLTRDQQIASLVTQIRAMTPASRPAFQHLFILNWSADLPLLQEVQRQLGPDYVAVRPEHLTALYRQYMAEEKVLIHAPAAAVALEGRPLLFTAGVQNVTAASLIAKAQVTEGLTGATLTPAGGKIASSETLPIVVQGVPSGDRITLDIQGPFGSHAQTLAVRRIPNSELIADLPANTGLRFLKQYAASTLPHSSGKMETAAEAAQGTVWAVRKGSAAPGYVMYGPYTQTPPGRYLVVFRVKRVSEGSGKVATLDAAVGGGKITKERPVDAAELPLNAYRSIGFVFDHPGGPLETRLHWAGEADLLIDSVTLWQLQPPHP